MLVLNIGAFFKLLDIAMRGPIGCDCSQFAFFILLWIFVEIVQVIASEGGIIASSIFLTK